MGIQDLLDRARGAEDSSDPDLRVPDDASELDEDLLPPDPKPTKRARAPRSSGSTPAKVTVGQRRQVEDALMLLMSVIGGGISMRDRVCGPALTENSSAVAKAAVPIICRNPALLAWFSGGAGFMDFFALLVALQPVVGTIWSHHITHTLGDAHGEEGDGDDYSAFSAPAI